MPTPRDHYETLGIPRSAGEAEIKSAYRKLARELHPDRNKAPDAAVKFNEVQQAYDVLSDASKKKIYDQYGHFPPGSPGSGGPDFRGGRAPWGDAGGPGPGGGFDGADISDVFESIFGGMNAGAAGGPGGMGGGGFGGFGRGTTAGKARAGKARDAESTIEVDFTTAALGGTRAIRVGDPPDKARDIEVTIPKAFADGGRLRVRGAGFPSSRGGPPGDLILTVRVAKHPLFRRDGLNLELDLPISLPEAALGAKINVPTLTGSVDLSIPPGTSSGQRLRLKGLGIKDDSGNAGDLFAVAKIVAPKSLEPDEQAALEKMGKRLGCVREGPLWSR
jgi:DnaJ-class molecular chaperone